MLRRIASVAVALAAPAAFALASFITAYFDPQPGTLRRYLLAGLAVVVAFVAAPAIVLSHRTRQRPVPEAGDHVDTPGDEEEPGETADADTTEPLARRLRRRLRRLRPADQPGRLIAGRDADLREMREMLAQSRAAARQERPGRFPRWRRRLPAKAAAGAAVLHIHGMPGVGKTVTAQALAAQLKADYPDGQVNVNLSNGPDIRRVTEVLRDLLLLLGYPDETMPPDLKGRQSLFRSLTNTLRLVVVLDAARDAAQVRELLPNGPRCAVLVTSRRDLAAEVGGASYTLRTPGHSAALQLLSHVVSAAVRPPRPNPIAAAEIVRSCGALPVALRAAGAYAVREGLSLEDIAADLSNPTTCLRKLAYDGENPTLLFDGEYDMLISEDERRAFRRLAIVDAETFVPWVLCPLLHVSLDEAENLVSRLVDAHLLETADLNIAQGPVRYRFHPLVRLFAMTKLTEDERGTCRKHLDIAYRGVVREALRRLGENVPPPAAIAEEEQLWMPPTAVLDRITGEPEQWVRAEHANLVQLVTHTSGPDPALCWRIALWLGGYVAPGCKPEYALAALETGLRAARDTRSPEGYARVLLAKGSLLLALEQYPDAAAALEEVIEKAEALHLRGLAAAAWRRRGEGCMQMGAYRIAIDRLQAAEAAARQAGDSAASERELIDLLLRVCHWQSDARHHLELDAYHMPPVFQDGRRFRLRLLNSDVARRAGAWAAAHAELDLAFDEHGGDMRRAAAIEYWRARLLLAEALVTDDDSSSTRTAAARAAAEGAARTALVFMDMENRLGQARARCLVGRALLAAGEHEMAADYYRQVNHFVDLLDKHLPPDQRPPLEHALLRARLNRFRGELVLCRMRTDALPPEAAAPARLHDLGDILDTAHTIEKLEETARAFMEYGDWAAEAETQVVLAQIKLLSGNAVGAAAAAGRAAEMFERGGNIPRQRQAQLIFEQATTR